MEEEFRTPKPQKPASTYSRKGGWPSTLSHRCRWVMTGFGDPCRLASPRCLHTTAVPLRFPVIYIIYLLHQAGWYMISWHLDKVENPRGGALIPPVLRSCNPPRAENTLQEVHHWQISAACTIKKKAGIKVKRKWNIREDGSLHGSCRRVFPLSQMNDFTQVLP